MDSYGITSQAYIFNVKMKFACLCTCGCISKDRCGLNEFLQDESSQENYLIYFFITPYLLIAIPFTSTFQKKIACFIIKRNSFSK